jgi:hypothetical protein
MSAGMFDYTQKNFWGGPYYKYWMLIPITILFGLIGGDHFFLRSPTTGVAKLLVNVVGLGIWWLYDIIQILVNKNDVMTAGLSAPIYGPIGVGAGMFRDNNPDAPPAKAPFRYLLYLVLLFLPYGFDSFVAGDTNGAAAKFICNMLWFMWPIAIVWQLISIGKAFFAPKSVFEEGVDRLFPFTFFMNAKGPSVLGPVDVPLRTDECDPGGSSGIIGTLLSPITMMFNTITSIIPNMISAILNVVAPGVLPAIKAIAGVATAGAKTAQVAVEATGSVIEAARNPAVAITAMGSSGLSAVSEAGSLGGQVGSELGQFTDPNKLKEIAMTIPPPVPPAPSVVTAMPTMIPATIMMPGATTLIPGAAAATMVPAAAAATAAAVQKGGGTILESGGSDFSTLALFGLFSAILLGGTYYGLKRLNTTGGIFSRTDPNARRERNDAPPKPHGL